MKSKFSVLMKKYPENSSWSWRDELKEKYPDIIITEEESISICIIQIFDWMRF